MIAAARISVYHRRRRGGGSARRMIGAVARDRQVETLVLNLREAVSQTAQVAEQMFRSLASFDQFSRL